MNDKMLMDIRDKFENEDLIVKSKLIHKGKSVKPHWHNYFEMEIIMDGEAIQVYNGERVKMERGSAYVLSYCDFHSFKAIEDVSLLSLRFKESVLPQKLAREIVSKPNKLICKFDEYETVDIAAKIQRIGNEVRRPELFGNIVCADLISEIIIAVIRKCRIKTTEEDSPLIQKTVAYINGNFRDRLTLESVAEEVSASSNYLGTLIKKSLGISFNDYLNNIRLKYACEILSTTNLSVKEIAYASGYASKEYFSYVFKNKIGITPLVYRKENPSVVLGTEDL